MYKTSLVYVSRHLMVSLVCSESQAVPAFSFWSLSVHKNGEERLGRKIHVCGGFRKIFHSLNFFSLYDGEKEYRGYTLFLHLIMSRGTLSDFHHTERERKRVAGYTLFPLQWKSESVPPTVFSHFNKMEKNSVPPTYTLFPIIKFKEWKIIPTLHDVR